MVSVRLSFPGGRYHATPWDHHTNEGVVEWPPSPWRFLRALVATRHLKAQEEVEEGTLAALVEALAGAEVAYALPPAVVSHTRHYMPEDGARTTRVFDTFVDVRGPSALWMVWQDLALGEGPTAALALLCERLCYLGRAESWVEAHLDPAPPPERDVSPVGEFDAAGPDRELVRVLCPLSQAALGRWRAQVGEVRARGPALPSTVLEALTAETRDLQSAGWSLPPGSRWVVYSRPRGAFEPEPARVQEGRVAPRPTVARFAITSSVLPRLVSTVKVVDRLHKTLVKLHPEAIFTGCGEDGAPLRTHDHVYLLGEGDESTGRLSHLTVYARAGLDPQAVEALEKVRRLWGDGGHDLHLALVGLGHPEEYAGPNPSRGESPALARARVWRSLTPFVSTRYIKTTRAGEPKRDAEGRVIGSPEHDLIRLMRLAGLPDPVAVEEIESARLQGKAASWWSFAQDRYEGGRVQGGRRSPHAGSGFRLTFAEEVQGPLAFGYNCHFGLGVFVPEWE